VATGKETITVRSLSESADLNEAVRLQKVIWDFEDVDLLPPRLFVVATKIGGQVFGAFDEARMVGFCVAIPGLRAGGGYYLHSHMLGVLEEYRNRGVGRMLKLEQRREALERGIDLIEWTFDPLEIGNAHFNIVRLGTVARRFVANQYGISSSPLHAGLPTDRLVAEWWISSPRVRALLDDRQPLTAAEKARIEVPVEIVEWKKTDIGRAREAQSRVRREFQQLFSQGLAVVGHQMTPRAGVFVLGEFQEPR
jgi:predicted GNAT superfamily acetyltransferase